MSGWTQRRGNLSQAARGVVKRAGPARASLRSDLRTCAAAGEELAQSGWKVERVREAAAGIDLQCLWRGGRPPSSGSVGNRGAGGLPGKEEGGGETSFLTRRL